MATNTHSMIWYCTVHSKSSELGETGVVNSRSAMNLNEDGGSVCVAVVAAQRGLERGCVVPSTLWCR